MTHPEWEQVQKIYHGALERSGGERSAYLDQACGDDRTLRSELDNLLAAHAERSKFLEDPDMSVDFDVLANWSKMEGKVKTEVDEAVTFAEASPLPPPESATEGVYCTDDCWWRKPL